MGVVLLQILQWILRIILFLLLLLVVLIAIVLIVPIRYQVEGKFLEKKPGGRGKITWFFYLIYMTFVYEEDFHIQVRVFGFKVYDSAKESSGKTKAKKKFGKKTKNIVEEFDTKREEVKDNLLESHDNLVSESSSNKASENILETRNEEKVIFENRIEDKQDSADELAAWEKEMEAEAKEEAKLADKVIREQSISSKELDKIDSQNIAQNQGDAQSESLNTKTDTTKREKKSFSEKIEGIKSKIQEIIQKIKDIIAKIQEGKLKVEHYLELWNRKETQITFSRVKTKLVKMIKAVLPRKWKVIGELGFSDPCTTGQIMGVLGAMYPIFGNKVQIVPDFENEVMNLEGSVKGHIRLGNLLYQLISLILNRHCFKVIKLVLDELGSSKKSQKIRR